MRHLFLLGLVAITLFVSISCSDKPINRYQCKDFENWALPQCNPPICLENRICTHDLYPKQYWNSIELQIFPISYQRLRVQEWIHKGIVEQLTLKQYIEGQNLRYIQALYNKDEELIAALIADADKVGYILLPSKFIGGVYK